MLRDLQRLLLQSCRQREPKAWLLQQLDRTDLELTTAERAALAAVDDDGLRLTRLLLQKLRLQRLLLGEPAAAAAFAADPAAFVARFREYAAAVPPTAVFPSEEAAAFRRHGGDDS